MGDMAELAEDQAQRDPRFWEALEADALEEGPSLRKRAYERLSELEAAAWIHLTPQEKGLAHILGEWRRMDESESRQEEAGEVLAAIVPLLAHGGPPMTMGEIVEAEGEGDTEPPHHAVYCGYCRDWYPPKSAHATGVESSHVHAAAPSQQGKVGLSVHGRRYRPNRPICTLCSSDVDTTPAGYVCPRCGVIPVGAIKIGRPG